MKPSELLIKAIDNMEYISEQQGFIVDHDVWYEPGEDYSKLCLGACLLIDSLPNYSIKQDSYLKLNIPNYKPLLAVNYLRKGRIGHALEILGYKRPKDCYLDINEDKINLDSLSKNDPVKWKNYMKQLIELLQRHDI